MKGAIHIIPMNVLAYIDPGSGLLVWQLLLGAMLGTLFYLKKVRGFLGRVGRKMLGRHHP